VLDMDADYYLETIDTVFQSYKLVHGTWDVRAPDGRLERVRPQDITSGALLTVEGELDDISGCGQTRAAHTLCSGLPARDERHIEVKGAGHYGIFSGRRWREMVYPQVRDFIAEHQGETSSAALPAPQAPTPAAAEPARREEAPRSRTAAARKAKAAAPAQPAPVATRWVKPARPATGAAEPAEQPDTDARATVATSASPPPGARKTAARTKA